VPTLAELQQQIVAEVGESLFSDVYAVVQVIQLSASLFSLLITELETDFSCKDQPISALMLLVGQQEGFCTSWSIKCAAPAISDSLL